MGRKQYTEEQIVFALRQAESYTPVAEIIRRLGVSEQTFYRWKKQFAVLGVAELRRLRTLEEETRKLKQLVADLKRDKKTLQDVLSKNSQACGQACCGEGGAGRVPACRASGLPGTGIRPIKLPLPEQTDPRAELRVRLRDLAASRVHDGNVRWSMDFMSDQLVGGQRFRLLTRVDNHSRESLAIEVGQRLTGDDVVRVLEQVTDERGKPQSIRVDKGPEFISRSLDLWA